MTETEFRDWINANINTNASRAITGALMNEFGQKCIDFFAHIDNPLLPYSTTIENGDLVDLAITITHNKGTWLPDFVMFDENGDAIYSEYFSAHVVDENNITFTFNDIIPATGNGYYKLIIWSAGLLNITPRYIEVFSSDFSAWTGGEPDDFIVEYPLFGNPTIENDTNRAKLTRDGLARIKLIPDIELDMNREYRISVDIDQGNLVIICGSQSFSLTGTGTNIIILTASDTELKIRQGTALIAILDDLIIEEAA